MKISAELALKQTLSLTHDMRLAIDMLTMTALEIDEVIDEELLKNPFLEEAETYGAILEMGSGIAHDAASAFDVVLDTSSATSDFRDELLQQVGESSLNLVEREISRYLINNLDDDGLLTQHETVYEFIEDELGVFTEWIDSVRRRIMNFEPLGCAALSSGESLKHQAKRLCRYPHREFLALVRSLQHDPDQKLTLSRLQPMKADDALMELRKLKPRPALGFDEKNAIVPSVVPEVVVKSGKDGFMVSLSKKPSERLVIKGYKERGKGNVFLRKNRKRALFMIKALEYRETSLAKVSNAIVVYQEAWLHDQGPLKPLNLREIADVCGLHESSVSRLTKGKFLSCEKGVFELKYFFSSRVQGEADGDGQSAISIKNQIKTIISREDKTQPLSDQKILEKLKDSGMVISRRTVTKYRENLDLKPAHLRRVLM